MAGTWLLGEQKVRPGTYYRVSSGDVTTVGAVNGVAAVIFHSNWGTMNRVVDVSQSDMNNLHSMFGGGEGVQAIKEALLGGATTVKAVRVGTTGTGSAQKAYVYAPNKDYVRKAQVTIDANGKGSFLTTKMTPVRTYKQSIKVRLNGWYKSGKYLIKTTDYKITQTKTAGNYTKREIQLTASGLAKLGADRKIRIYEYYTIKGAKLAYIYSRKRGDYGFTCSLQTNLITGKRQMNFYDERGLFDSVTFEAGGNEVQKLKTALDGSAKFYMAKVYGSGVLGNFASRKMTKGTNPTVTVADYSNATDLLERHYWNVLLADSNTTNVRSLLTEYVKQSYETGRLGMAVIGSNATASFDSRLAFATAVNDWRVVYVANSWTDINGTEYSGWKAAARIGGMIAACETNASLTHIVISNATELLNPMTNGEMIQAEEKGCLCLSYNDEGQVWIDNAINTLITLGNDQDEGWKKIRRTKCRFELMTRINRTCDKLIGRLNNDTNGRATLITAMQSIINEMIAEGKLFFGSYVAEDTRYKPAGDRAYFVLYISDIDSIEKVYLDFNFTYANRFE